MYGVLQKSLSLCLQNKGYLRVTTNLHLTFKCLRYYALDRIIWVDTININQYDTEERN